MTDQSSGSTARTSEAPSPAPEPTRYAAYDNTLLKFTGGIHPTKKAAADAAKKHGVDDYEIREV